MHIFFTCQSATDVWQQVDLYNNVHMAVDNGGDRFINVLFHMLESVSLQQRKMVAMMVWSIGKRRNEKVWAQ